MIEIWEVMLHKVTPTPKNEVCGQSSEGSCQQLILGCILNFWTHSLIGNLSLCNAMIVEKELSLLGWFSTIKSVSEENSLHFRKCPKISELVNQWVLPLQLWNLVKSIPQVSPWRIYSHYIIYISCYRDMGSNVT